MIFDFTKYLKFLNYNTSRSKGHLGTRSRKRGNGERGNLLRLKFNTRETYYALSLRAIARNFFSYAQSHVIAR